MLEGMLSDVLRYRRTRNNYRRGVIQVKVGFLDAFAMIALGIGEAEEAFFEEVTINY